MSFAARLTPFFLVTLIFMASLVQASTPPMTHKSTGLLLFPEIKDAAAITFPVFAEADDNTLPAGQFVMRIEENIPHHTYVVSEQIVDNPDAGLFDNKTKILREEKILMEYVSPTKVFAPYITEDKGAWLHLQHGWVKRADVEAAGATPLSWEQVVTHPLYPEFTLPENADAYAKRGKVEDMRKQADYVPLGNLSVYKSASEGSVSLATIQSPLRVAIIGVEGDWLNVFVVLGRCDNASGKTDYREGISGWIKRHGAHKAPAIARSPETC